MTEPATTQPVADKDLMREVAVACRAVRRQGQLHYPAWLAARAVVMERRPELDLMEAGKLATRIIAWASQEHTAWF